MMPGDNGEGDTVADAPETPAAAAGAAAGEPPPTTEEQEQAVHAAYNEPLQRRAYTFQMFVRYVRDLLDLLLCADTLRERV